MANPNPGPHSDSLGQDSPDPSMEDILASIRRILNDGDAAAAPAQGSDSAGEPANPAAPQAGVPLAGTHDDVFLLDAAMMVEIPPDAIVADMREDIPEPAPGTPPKPDTLVAPETMHAASSSMGALVRALADRHVPITRGNSLTLEDIVRDELRPLVASWLDEHLPPLVERLVRAEIERVVGRAVG